MHDNSIMGKCKRCVNALYYRSHAKLIIMHSYKQLCVIYSNSNGKKLFVKKSNATFLVTHTLEQQLLSVCAENRTDYNKKGKLRKTWEPIEKLPSDLLFWTTISCLIYSRFQQSFQLFYSLFSHSRRKWVDFFESSNLHRMWCLVALAASSLHLIPIIQIHLLWNILNR